MKTLANSPIFYLLFPVYFSLALLIIFFNIPDGFYLSLFLLYFVLTPIVLVGKFLFSVRMQMDRNFELILKIKKHRMIMMFFVFFVVISGALDVYVNGLKLLDPGSYAEFNGVGRYIRHVSIQCWVLVPIAFIYFGSSKFKMLLVGYALIFPVIILDRNRLFTSFYALALCLVLTPSSSSYNNALLGSPKRRLVILILSVFLIFSVMGFFRSGADAFVIETSGDVLGEEQLPLREIFYYLPSLFQQVILYITTPLFNFATIVYYDFINQDFLLSQLAPFSRDLFDLYPYAPVLVQRFNVGTEFYPFLLYGGVSFVVLSVAFLVLAFFASCLLFKTFPNIFTFLIFIKISYSVLFMGFAPQFYILLNFAFILLMMILWLGSEVLYSALRCSTREKEEVSLEKA